MGDETAWMEDADPAMPAGFGDESDGAKAERLLVGVASRYLRRRAFKRRCDRPGSAPSPGRADSESTGRQAAAALLTGPQ